MNRPTHFLRWKKLTVSNGIGLKITLKFIFMKLQFFIFSIEVVLILKKKNLLTNTLKEFIKMTIFCNVTISMYKSVWIPNNSKFRVFALI